MSRRSSPRAFWVSNLLSSIFPTPAKPRMNCRVGHLARKGVQNAGWPEAVMEIGKIRHVRIIREFRALLNVQVVQVA
jgi:hypothetical protein